METMTTKDTNNKDSKSEIHSFIKLFIGMFVFTSVMVFQIVNTSISTNLQGIIAQIQVMISVFMVISVYKKGYIVTLFLNIMECTLATERMISTKNLSLLPGIVVPVCTIITTSIILYYLKRLNSKIKEALEEKDEITILYKEVITAHDKTNLQNEQLQKYNLKLAENESKLYQLAYHDELSELPNRKMLLKELGKLCEDSRVNEHQFAVVFIDLDNFKTVNDSMGHSEGDKLLQQVGRRLKLLIYPEDIAGRLGGDEFALLIRTKMQMNEVLIYIEHIKLALQEIFDEEVKDCRMSSSIGISYYPKDGNTSKELLKAADMAMYQAKYSGKNRICLFEQWMKEKEI